jgi:bacterioferritin-associated ferredoxin
MIRVLALTAHETLRRRVTSQPFCGRCAAPLCLSRAVSVEEKGEGRKTLTLSCGACFEEMAEVVENPGSYTVLDGRKLFRRNKKGGKR